MRAYFGEAELNSLIIPVDKDYPGKNNESGSQFFLKILQSIKHNGIRRPIIVRETEVLIGGARVRAAYHLGFKTIPAIIFSSTEPPNFKRINSYDELLKLSRLSHLVVTKEIFQHRN